MRTLAQEAIKANSYDSLVAEVELEEKRNDVSKRRQEETRVPTRAYGSHRPGAGDNSPGTATGEGLEGE